MKTGEVSGGRKDLKPPRKVSIQCGGFWLEDRDIFIQLSIRVDCKTQMRLGEGRRLKKRSNESPPKSRGHGQAKRDCSRPAVKDLEREGQRELGAVSRTVRPEHELL